MTAGEACKAIILTYSRLKIKEGTFDSPGLPPVRTFYCDPLMTKGEGGGTKSVAKTSPGLSIDRF